MTTPLQRLAVATLSGAVAMAAILAGCSSAPKNVEKSDYSGFLSDYSRLQPEKTPSGTPVMRWISPDLAKGNYTKVYLEPPVLFLGKGQEPTKQVPKETMDQIVSYLGSAQRGILQSQGALAAGPGPNTLRARSAVTAVRSGKQGLKPYEYIPVALLFAGAQEATGTRDVDTEIYIEGELSDSQTGEVLAEFARKDPGPELKDESKVLTLDDVKPLLDKWIQDFYTQLKTHSKVQ